MRRVFQAKERGSIKNRGTKDQQHKHSSLMDRSFCTVMVCGWSKWRRSRLNTHRPGSEVSVCCNKDLGFMQEGGEPTRLNE